VAGIEMQSRPDVTLRARALRVLADRGDSHENVKVEA
jgi:hypothetical protein